MLKKIRIILVIHWLFLPFSLFSQVDKSNDFSQQMVVFSDRVTAIVDEINVEKVDAIELLARAPVKAESIEKSLVQITSPSFDKESALNQAQEFSETLQQSVKQLTEQSSSLLALKDTMKKLSLDGQMLKQRLNNPISKTKLSNEEQVRLAKIIDQAEQLQHTYETKQAKLSSDKILFVQATDLMALWKGALIDKLADNKTEVAKSDVQKTKLEQRKLAFEKEAEALQTQLDKDIALLSNEQVVTLQEKIYHTRTQVWLVETDISLGDIIVNRVTANHVNSAVSVDELSTQLQSSNARVTELKAIQNQLNIRIEELKKHDALLGENKDLSDGIASTQKVISYQLIKQSPLPKRISDLLLLKNQSALLKRQPWLSRENFIQAKIKFSESALQVGYQLFISVQTLWQQILTKSLNVIIASLISVLFLIVFLKLAHKLTSIELQSSAYERWVVVALQKVLSTIGGLQYWIVSAVYVMILVLALNVPSPSDDIIFLVAWCLIITPVGFTILARETRAKTVTKYLLVQGYVSFACLISTSLFYGLAVLSSIDTAVTQLCEIMLMLALIVVSITLYRMVRYYARHERVDNTEKFYNSYRQFLTGLPLLGALIGVVSLIGYQQMAWLSLKYLGLFTVFGVVVIIGLVMITHLRKRAKIYSTKSFQYGAFISQDIVSPLSIIAKLSLIYFAGYCLFTSLGWDKNSYIVTQALTIADYPLVTFGETIVNSKMLCLTVLSLYLIFHVARWLKRFAYHWLFVRVKDLGVRNSLAIFGQYLFTLVGLLFALKFLGINLTSFAVFAGALGVGIGLGLQDIAKSFISGIILLIERPLRTGDWVVIDDSEGVVRSIGLRAITLETFDKQEVIIPNGNAINNSFINYTHSNDIIRTIVFVGASYSTPPKVVIELLKQTVSNVNGLLSIPKPQIMLWEYADSSINYRIQYCVDVNKNNIWDIKTEVLSDIWYAFEENGLEIPFPQRDIHVKNVIVSKEDED